jgi:hypothetical protein
MKKIIFLFLLVCSQNSFTMETARNSSKVMNCEYCTNYNHKENIRAHEEEVTAAYKEWKATRHRNESGLAKITFFTFAAVSVGTILLFNLYKSVYG